MPRVGGEFFTETLDDNGNAKILDTKYIFDDEGKSLEQKLSELQSTNDKFSEPFTVQVVKRSGTFKYLTLNEVPYDYVAYIPVVNLEGSIIELDNGILMVVLGLTSSGWAVTPLYTAYSTFCEGDYLGRKIRVSATVFSQVRLYLDIDALGTNDDSRRGIITFDIASTANAKIKNYTVTPDDSFLFQALPKRGFKASNDMIIATGLMYTSLTSKDDYLYVTGISADLSNIQFVVLYDTDISAMPGEISKSLSASNARMYVTTRYISIPGIGVFNFN